MEKDRPRKDLGLEDKWASVKTRNLLLERDLDLVDGDLEEDGALGEIRMPRPRKMRRVVGKPNSSYFKPAGIRMNELVEVVLTMDEFEAIRLIDFEGVSQVDAGDKMHISQSTLSRMLSVGRRKIADCLVNGKGIRIEK